MDYMSAATTLAAMAGAVVWVRDNWHYVLIAGKTCLRVRTPYGDSGTIPTGFDIGWFDPSNYDLTYAISVPNPALSSSNDEVQMKCWHPVLSVWWWGPRNKYYRPTRDLGIEDRRYYCGTNPATSNLLVLETSAGVPMIEQVLFYSSEEQNN